MAEDEEHTGSGASVPAQWRTRQRLHSAKTQSTGFDITFRLEADERRVPRNTKPEKQQQKVCEKERRPRTRFAGRGVRGDKDALALF